MTAHVVAFGNQKGGVGKTTCTVNVAWAYVQMGLRVLLIDADPQANATAHVGLETPPPFTLNDVLTVDPTTGQVAAGVIGDAVVPAQGLWAGLDVVASELTLAAREQDQNLGREYRLRTALEGTLERWDVVLIDCPPSLGQLTVNGLTAADAALLVTEPRAGSVDGLAQMTRTVNTVRKHFNSELRLAGIVVNRWLEKRPDRTEWVERLREDYGQLLLEPMIFEREVIGTATSATAPLTAYGAKTRELTDAMNELAKRLLPVRA